MNMKKKILALAIASSLAVPQVALAAEDDFGMQYTSASEGFYASIRAAIYANSAKKDGSVNLDGSFSRFGIAGTNDLGGGLEGFYTYEAGVDINNGGGLKTRLGNVGLRGAFGEIVAGSIWHNAYNWTDSATNIATVYSGYNYVSGGIKSKVVQYTSPDLNGFQVSILGQFDNTKDGEGELNAISTGYRTGLTGVASEERAAVAAVPAVGSTPAVAAITSIELISETDATVGRTVTKPTDAQLTGVIATHGYGDSVTGFIDRNNNGLLNGDDIVIDIINTNPKDNNDLDEWSVAAKYDIQGFSLGAAYYGRPDALSKNAAGTSRAAWNAWVLKASYGQDNWSVGGWYSNDNASDAHNVTKDQKKFGLGGTVTVDKIGLYGFYENVENVVKNNVSFNDDSTAGVGINYNLGAKTKVFVEYFSQNLDSETTEEDDILIGLRHDF